MLVYVKTLHWKNYMNRGENDSRFAPVCLDGGGVTSFLLIEPRGPLPP